MSELVAEMQFLRACFRSCLDASGDDEELAPLLASVNWDHMLWLAREQRSLLVLDNVLKRPRWAVLCPPEVLAQVAAFREVNQMRALGRGAELCSVQDLFGHHAIEAISVDRWAFEQATRGRPDLVEIRGPLGYLVHPADRGRAEAVLLEAGHAVRRDPSKLVSKGKRPVVLNEGLAGHPGAGRLWSQAAPFELGGRRLLQLAPADWLLQFLAGREGQGRPSLADAWGVVSLVKRLPDRDWTFVLAEAGQFGLREALGSELLACHEELGAPLPGGLSGLLALRGHSAESLQSPAPAAQTLPTSPFLPTPPVVARRLLQLAGVGPDDLVCDLGCGDGRIVVMAAKEFGSRGLGVDSDPVRIAEATRLAAEAGVSERVKFECGELFDANLADATVLCLYLLPPLFPALLRKLQREARPGLRVVSHDYVFPGWAPERTEIIRTGLTRVSQIYMWRLG
jgi:hypothetical protein